LDITQQLCAIAKTLRCNFTLQDQPISFERVFSESGLLPAIMRRADQLSSFCLGYGLGITYTDQGDAMLGVKAEFDDKTANTLRVMCALDVIIEIMQNAPSRTVTPIDELLIE